MYSSLRPDVDGAKRSLLIRTMAVSRVGSLVPGLALWPEEVLWLDEALCSEEANLPRRQSEAASLCCSGCLLLVAMVLEMPHCHDVPFSLEYGQEE